MNPTSRNSPRRTMASKGGEISARPDVKTALAFIVLLVARTSAALFSPIQDCDETFNFWEPTHYLTHGYGLETWEFSPEYRIRSWLYVVLHAAPIYVVSLLPLSVTKVAEFYILRGILGLVSTICETLLYKSLARSVNRRVAVIFLIVAVFSPGFFHASVAYLPSSFAMYAVILAMHSFLHLPHRSDTVRGVMWIGIGAVIGWPFVGVLAMPLILDELMGCLNGNSFLPMIANLVNGGIRSLASLVLEIVVDSLFYRKFTSIPFNIVFYNVFAASSKGPDIFGIEPWHFYIRNLLINFHLWFILALLAVPLVLIQRLLSVIPISRLGLARMLTLALPFYVWMAIFTLQPHKEERFMYPAYPLLSINAAISLHVLILAISGSQQNYSFSRLSISFRLLLLGGFVMSCAVLGLWRIFGLTTAYRAPLSIYSPLQAPGATQPGDFVCIGKEWYRFPSSYHLPQNARLKFLKSEFRGLLPGEFEESVQSLYGILPPTWITPDGMNDANREDPNKHIEPSRCEYLIDFTAGGVQTTSLEPDYVGDAEGWEKIACKPFLDSAQTHLIGRLFWIPNWPLIPYRFRRKWGAYCLLRRT